MNIPLINVKILHLLGHFSGGIILLRLDGQTLTESGSLERAVRICLKGQMRNIIKQIIKLLLLHHFDTAFIVDRMFTLAMDTFGFLFLEPKVYKTYCCLTI